MLRFRVFFLFAIVLASCGRTDLFTPRPDAGSTDHDAGECSIDAECDDGTFCNGAEICASGSCMPGSAELCDDGVPCTADLCDTGLDRCTATPDSTVCASNELCDAVSGCVVRPCNGPIDCDDGLPCNGVETCGASNLCVAGSPVVCDDGFACTLDACDPTTGACVVTTDDSICADGAFCSGVEVCVAGLGCTTSSTLPCEDGDACTVDTCDEAADACAHDTRDQDTDGFPDALCGGLDCDDLAAAVNPGAPESCAGGVDDDCDGAVDCADSSCASAPSCMVCQVTETSCTNGVDDDCDMQIDCADATCSADAACCVPSTEQCRNGRDDDCDGATDCNDPQCAANLLCTVPCLPFEVACARFLSIDGDCDGLASCADPDCSGARLCR